MKTLLVTACCVLSIIGLGAIAFSIHSSNQTTIARQQMQASKSQISNLADAVKSSEKSIAVLQNTVSKLSNDLNQSAAQLSAANDKIQSYALAEQKRLDDERKKYLESVPAPTLAGKLYIFPKVVRSNGATMATNTAFVSITGRRLLFRPTNTEQTSFTMDVDDVHPLMLQYLGIDGEAVKERQRQINEQAAADAAARAEANRIQYEVDRQAWEAGAPAREAKRIADAQLAIEQEKADAAKRTADAAQQQAAANAKAADAAMINAQKPPAQVTTVVQQVQQVKQQPIPRGYIENNGVLTPYY